MKNIIPATLIIGVMIFVFMAVAKAESLQKKPAWAGGVEYLGKSERPLYYQEIKPRKPHNKKSYFSVKRERRTPVIRPIVRLYGKIRHQ